MGTLLHEMKRRGRDCRFGVISMCIGWYYMFAGVSLSFHLCILTSDSCDIVTATGMGAAAVFERGDCVDELCNARMIQANNLLSRDAL